MILRFLIVLAVAFSLPGCAWFTALPLAAQIPIAAGAAAALGSGGMLTVTTIHDCKKDGGCKEIPLPP